MNQSTKPLLANYQSLPARKKKSLMESFANAENGVKRSQFYNMLHMSCEELESIATLKPKELLDRLKLFAAAFNCQISDLYQSK